MDIPTLHIPKVYRDSRGYFLETYNRRVIRELGIFKEFVQDNHSYSERDVLRGLHYQTIQPQGKLVTVIVGEILDVAVNLTTGAWWSFVLSEENKNSLWIPQGFAHGFYVRSECAHVIYKATDFYSPESEHTILWNDPVLSIDWQLRTEPIVSEKDQKGTSWGLRKLGL
jgi:dTDP-4-dehydrorhamnose 3,5-epimerase